jgi:hypothetical protein
MEIRFGVEYLSSSTNERSSTFFKEIVKLLYSCTFSLFADDVGFGSLQTKRLEIQFYISKHRMDIRDEWQNFSSTKG